MIKIGLLRGSQNGNIAVLTPQNIMQLKNQAVFYIEKNVGSAFGYTDENYTKAGATIINPKQRLIDTVDLILSYNFLIGNEKIDSNKIFVGAYDILNDYRTIIPFQRKKVSVYSLNLLPAAASINNRFMSFLKHYLTNNDSEILKAAKVITDGKITNQRLILEIDNL